VIGEESAGTVEDAYRCHPGTAACGKYPDRSAPVPGTAIGLIAYTGRPQGSGQQSAWDLDHYQDQIGRVFAGLSQLRETYAIVVSTLPGPSTGGDGRQEDET
jgi:hypothetical protein